MPATEELSPPPAHLGGLLARAAADHPGRPAVEDERGKTWTYAELDRAAERLATRLARWGVGREDRVGLLLFGGFEAVAAIHGILRSGAAYVPADPAIPAAQGAGLLAGAHVKAVVVAAELADPLRRCWPGPIPPPRLVLVGDEGATRHPDAAWDEIQADDAPRPLSPMHHPDDLAQVLLVSDASGRPAGVMHTHAGICTFLEWCRRTFLLGPSDRIGAHAPLHSGLSTFNLFAPCLAGGTLILIGESPSPGPGPVGRALLGRRIDVWHSTPSILRALAREAGPEPAGSAAPRLVLFTGAGLPLDLLRCLRRLWPGAGLWSLHGSAEAHVVTAYPIPATIHNERSEPFPIGWARPPLRTRVVDEAGAEVAPGVPGELLVSGLGVMRGYFGRPDLDAAAFLIDPQGTAWFRTGDTVTADESSCYTLSDRSGVAGDASPAPGPWPGSSPFATDRQRGLYRPHRVGPVGLVGRPIRRVLLD